MYLKFNEISLILDTYILFYDSHYFVYDSHCIVSSIIYLMTWRWPNANAETCRQFK